MFMWVVFKLRSMHICPNTSAIVSRNQPNLTTGYISAMVTAALPQQATTKKMYKMNTNSSLVNNSHTAIATSLLIRNRFCKFASPVWLLGTHDACKVFFSIVGGAIQTEAITQPGTVERGAIVICCLTRNKFWIFVHAHKRLGLGGPIRGHEKPIVFSSPPSWASDLCRHHQRCL